MGITFKGDGTLDQVRFKTDKQTGLVERAYVRIAGDGVVFDCTLPKRLVDSSLSDLDGNEGAALHFEGRFTLGWENKFTLELTSVQVLSAVELAQRRLDEAKRDEASKRPKAAA